MVLAGVGGRAPCKHVGIAHVGIAGGVTGLEHDYLHAHAHGYAVCTLTTPPILAYVRAGMRTP